MSDIGRVVLEVLQKVAKEHSIDPESVQSHVNLVDIGFKSIDLARIIALLELELEVDPFERHPITDIRTMSDLCEVYENEFTRMACGDAPSMGTEWGKPTRTPLDGVRRSAPQEGKKPRNVMMVRYDSHARPGSIAIIGMAGSFPGAPTLDQFWTNIVEGVESITFFSDDELLKAGVDPEWVRHPAL